MSIMKKFSITLISSLLILYLLSSTFSITYFRNTVRRSTRTNMESLISFNTGVLNSFLSSVHEMALHLVSDKALGQLLSYHGTHRSDLIQNASAINLQFTHYSIYHNTGSIHLKNTLFLDENLPVSNQLMKLTMKRAANYNGFRVFRDSLIQHEPWYQMVKGKNIHTYVTFDKTSGLLLFVRRLQNTYYTGAWRKDGIGTIVVSIPPKDFDTMLSMKSLTPHSAYIILNSQNDILLDKNTTPAIRNYFTEEASRKQDFITTGKTLTLDGKEWELHSRTLENNLKLVYLTSLSDIRSTIWHTLQPTFVITGALLFITIMLSLILSEYFTHPIIRLSKAISGIQDTTDFHPEIFEPYRDKELKALCRSFEEMIQNINEQTEARQESERKSQAMELRSLQAQINPHFLFNAMDLVNWLALSRGQDDIADIVGAIAEILRYSITEADSLISLEDELTICRKYMEIYKLRYLNPIELQVRNDQGWNIYLPKFCIQPLVENSIRHSSETHEDALTMTLDVQRQGDEVVIRLTDNGQGADPDLLNRYLKHEPDVPLKVSNGFGIRNVNERLHLKFRGNASLHYEKDQEGHLCAVLVFPYVTQRQEFMKGEHHGERDKREGSDCTGRST